MQKATTVDAYITQAPKEVQGRLRAIRRAITSIAPKALEKISYGMPYYSYKGRLAYFAYAKKHIGVYLTPPIITQYAQELKDYSTSTATIRFPNDQKLPLNLIKKLVRARVKLNNEQKSRH